MLEKRINKKHMKFNCVKSFLEKKLSKKNYSYTVKDFQEHFKYLMGRNIARTYFKNFCYLDLLSSGKNMDMERYIPMIDTFIKATYKPE
jgi:hypothetical protein